MLCNFCINFTNITNTIAIFTLYFGWQASHFSSFFIQDDKNTTRYAGMPEIFDGAKGKPLLLII